MQQTADRELKLAVTDKEYLAIAVVSVVTTMVQTGNTAPEIIGIILLVLKMLVL